MRGQRDSTIHGCRSSCLGEYAMQSGLESPSRLVCTNDIDGHCECVRSENGVRTLKAEFDKVASHNEHHLKQIELALKGFGA
jgi:hypothetical protein